MKQSPLVAVFFGIAVLLSSGLTCSAQEVIINGGFESSSPPANFGPGWSHSDPSDFDWIGIESEFAHSGSNYANLGTTDPDFGSLSQTFATTVGMSYDLSFWLAHDVTDSPSNSFEVLFGGVPVVTLAPDVGAFDYTHFTISGLVATSTSTTLEFRYQDNDDFFRLDDVSVVPEPPATWLALVGLSFFGLAAYRRSSRRGSTLV